MIDLLSEIEKNELTQISDEIEKEEIIKNYSLSKFDLVNANKYRTDTNKLGFALQLCVLRHKGWSLSYIKKIPDIIILFVAEQLKINPEVFEDYSTRKNTVFEHFRDIKNLYGYKTEIKFDFLDSLFEKSDNSYFIIFNCIETFKNNKVVPPAIYRIEEIVSKGKVKFEEKILEMISSELTHEQKLKIDDLLNISENRAITILAWLRENNGRSSTDEFLDTVKKFRTITDINIQLTFKKYPFYKIDNYIKLGKRYEPYSFKRFENNKRYSILSVYLQELKQTLIDKVITINDVRINDVFSKIRKTQDENLKTKKKKIRDTIAEYVSFGDTVITAKDKNINIDNEIEKSITWEKFKTSIGEAKNLLENSNKNTLDYLNKYYNDFRKYTPKLLETLRFETTTSSSKDLMNAINIIKDLNNTKKNILPDEIEVNFTNKKWQKAIEERTGTEKRHYFELAVFNELRNSLRSGDISVSESKSFKTFEAYLVSKEDWKKEMPITKLKVGLSFDEYLETKEAKLTKLLKEYSKNTALFNEVIAEDNKIHLRKLEKNTPKEAKELSECLYKMIPKINLPDLLYEILKSTNFHKHFKHAATQKPVETLEDITLLIFSIMALGTNVGISNMSESLTNISYRQLANEVDWRLLDENIANAQAEIVNSQLKEFLTEFWGDGKTSSSDGMRVRTSVNALNAAINPHFGAEKGLMMYRFVNDKYAAFYITVSGPNDRDGLHVIDGFLNHKSDLQIKEHYTDTAGYTYQVFAISSLIGVRFAPRIRNLPDSKLYGFDRDRFPKLKKLVTGTINTKLIRENFDDILRLTHSVLEGNVKSELILRKLGSYSRNNSLANSLKEIGKIEKTIFILEYASDPEFRRRILVGLNKGEEMNGLARIVFFGRRGQFWEHDFQEQFQKASCLNLILNAIVHWNTKYLAKAWEHYKSEHPDADERLLKYISPLNWKHINFLGKYLFDTMIELEKDNLRKLNIA